MKLFFALLMTAATALTVMSGTNANAIDLTGISLNRWGGPNHRLNVSKITFQFSNGVSCKMIASDAFGDSTADIFITNAQGDRLAENHAITVGGRPQPVFFVGEKFREISAQSLRAKTHAALRAFMPDNVYVKDVTAPDLKLTPAQNQKFIGAVGGVQGLNQLKSYCATILKN